ncbi:MAG TPA: energy transducer TonB [Lacunisphaera sp.]|nr:energy transducer TonB [Lacunisphaera sp.]
MPRRLLLLAAGLSAIPAVAPAAHAPVQIEGDMLQLPDMKVGGGGLTLKDFELPEKRNVTPPDFPPNDPFIHVQFPGTAVFEGVATGRATVGVMLDRSGHPVDFLLIRYTKPYFGQALLEEAKDQQYTPKRLKGVAIPGPFTFSYHFEPPAGLNISSFEAAARRVEEVGGGPAFVYQPHREDELDGRQLEPIRIAIPVLPAGHPGAEKRPLKVLVSFYVDELGRVRLPNVETALAPELVAPALHALQQWAFKPPTIKTRPVLVRAMRAVTFREVPPTANK